MACSLRVKHYFCIQKQSRDINWALYFIVTFTATWILRHSSESRIICLSKIINKYRGIERIKNKHLRIIPYVDHEGESASFKLLGRFHSLKNIRSYYFPKVTVLRNAIQKSLGIFLPVKSPRQQNHPPFKYFYNYRYVHSYLLNLCHAIELVCINRFRYK